MKETFDDGRGSVNVKTRPELTGIQLLDHQFQLVARGLGRLTLRVEPGLYNLRYDTGLSTHQEYISVSKDGATPEPRVVNIPFPSPAPIAGTTDYDRRIAEAAAELSRNPRLSLGNGGRLMIFAQNIGENPEANPSLRTLGVSDSSLRRIDDNWDAVRLDDAGRWAGWCAAVDPGGYLLHWPSCDDSDELLQSLWVSPGAITMVFLAVGRGASSRVGVDHNQLTIHQAPIEVGFEPFQDRATTIQCALELALARWKSGHEFLPVDEKTLQILIDEQFANPLLGIVAAHSLWHSTPPERDLLRRLYRSLRELLPDHPDMIVLEAVARQNRLFRSPETPPLRQLEWPPMFEASFRAAVQIGWREDTIIARHSYASRIPANLLYDTIWTMWSPVDSRHPEFPAEPSFRELAPMEMEALGYWLVTALRSVVGLSAMIEKLAEGVEPEVLGAQLWSKFEASNDPALRRLVVSIRRGFESALSSERFDRFRRFSLSDFARMNDLPRLEITEALARLLSECIAAASESSASPADIEWPPQNGKQFVKSESFGRMLVEEVIAPLVKKYPDKDFTDAAAHVFSWFDQKLRTNRSFLNARRFPSKDSFLSYLRQAVWNASRMSERRRRDHELLSEDYTHQQLCLEPSETALLREKIDALPELEREILRRLFFAEQDVDEVARELGLSRRRLVQVLEAALDKLDSDA